MIEIAELTAHWIMTNFAFFGAFVCYAFFIKTLVKQIKLIW